MSEIELRRKFSDYMQKLEQQVMIRCVQDKVFEKKIMVSTKPSKLLSTEFGSFIGSVFEYDKILVFNYYGLMKVSTGFKKEIQRLQNQGFDIKSAETIVVYFASLKVKHITEYSSDLVTNFSEFKDFLVSKRKFPTK